MIEISKISNHDIAAIKNISDKVNVKFVKRPISEGFLVNNPSTITYLNRLKKTDFNFCVRNYDGNIIGFILCISKEELLNPQVIKLLNYETVLIDSVKSIQPNYLWLDQIAILPKYRKNGIGTRLLFHALEKAKENGINKFVGSISLFPEFNLPSYQFLKKHNFDINFTVPQHNNPTQLINRVWGIFTNK